MALANHRTSLGPPRQALETLPSRLHAQEILRRAPHSSGRVGHNHHVANAGKWLMEQAGADRRTMCTRAGVMDKCENGSLGFATIPEALQDVAMGKFVVVLDDEGRENEGDLIMAGSKVTPKAMAFMVEHTSGVVCLAMEGADLDRLRLPLMVESAENEEAMRTAFTVTVDLIEGISTGISASDRSKTIRQLSDPCSQPHHFRRPGHIFPLRYHPGGVIARPGHTEAAVDLARLAGCTPAGVLCEVVDKRDGSMARTPYLLRFANEHGLKCITIQDLIDHRLRRECYMNNSGMEVVSDSWRQYDKCA